MPKPLQPNLKLEALQKNGTVNNRSKDVSDPLFQEDDFFDNRDILQVKYEMLRRVKKDKIPVTEVASSFGFSRIAFYKIQTRFDMNGLAGLLPQQRGPKKAHKLTPEIMDFIEEMISEDTSLSAPALVEHVYQHFRVSVHARSIERALERRQKKN